MSMWNTNNMDDVVAQILGNVHVNNPDGHHFGRPFLSAYQIAIAIHRDHPDVYAALDMPVGGAGTGQHNSLAQYVARQLSGRISSNADYPVEGAFMSNEDVSEFRFRRGDGREFASSLTNTPWDLSMFRLRQ